MKRSPVATRNVLTSRFARRVLLLFFASALLPVLLVGFLSFRSVVDNLLKQEHRRIHQQAKGTAMGIVERLLLLEAELELIGASRRGPGLVSPLGDPELSDQLGLHFREVAVSDVSGAAVETLWTWGEDDADDPRPPEPRSRFALDAGEREHLAAGRSLLRTVPAERSLMADVYLGRAIRQGDRVQEVVWGRVHTEFLWGVGAQNPLPPSTELAVVDSGGALLLRSLEVTADAAIPLAAAIADSVERRFEWSHGGRPYLAGFWSIPLQTNYRGGVWTVVVSEERRVAMAAIAEFERTFPLVLLLSIWIVLLLSLVQIRRSLGPLESLRKMANRIADRDFSQRVSIRSGDEFEELGDALNWMASRLGEQFSTLSAHATIGRSVLAGATLAEISRTALATVREATGSTLAGLAVAEDESGERCTGYLLTDGDTGDRGAAPRLSAAPLRLDALPSLARLRAGEAVAVEGPGQVVSELEPLLGSRPRPDVRTALLIPLTGGGSLVGVLAVASSDSARLSPESERLVSDLANQLALALHGARLRAELEAERRRLARLVEHLPDGVLVVDGARRVVLANRIGRRVLGVLAGITVGERLERIGGHPLDELAPAAPGPRQEIVIDQPERRVFTVATGLLGGTLDPQSMVIVVRETTREREIEEQMQRQERLAAVGRLAAGIAHDFNNLLQGVVMAGEVLAMHAGLPEALRGMARDVSQEGHRGAQLIRQILDFSRSSSSTREPLDIRELVEVIVRLLRRTLPETIRITVDIAEGDHVVYANATQIQQVITNLAVNARDAMPDGGSLRFRIRRVDVSLDATSPVPDLSPGAWVRIDVSDTGHGIPAEARPHLFEPFFTTKPVGRGTGLGLAQAYGIVSDHGGIIRFTTVEGRGTTFSLLLPRQEAILPAGAERIPDGRPARGERLLLVEDNPAVLRTIREGLEESGFNVVVARHGAEALARYREQEGAFDLVVSDTVMPEMDGLELTRRLRRISPKLPIVLMSGYPLGHRSDEIEALEVCAFLPKPFTLDRLRRTLVQAIDGELPGAKAGRGGSVRG